MSAIPLSILDLAPVSSGSTPKEALRNTVDLAQQAESFGYRRHWVAEHHFNPGVASSSPAVLIALIASATRSIRVGSGAVLAGNTTAAVVLEQFATVDALHPGRIDLGLGRSGQRRAEVAAAAVSGAATTTRGEERVIGGLLLPAPFDPSALLTSARARAGTQLLRQDGSLIPNFAEQVADIQALLAGTFRTSDDVPVQAVPGNGADIEVWLLGSSAGESAQLAGQLGLPFGANYHVAPSAVLDAVTAYRDTFRPSSTLAEPYVMVSADVVVAETEDQARELATPYAAWVRSIRTGVGAIPFPTPDEARGFDWTDEERAIVDDRVRTQFVGTPSQVAERLGVLREVTGADELLVTTVTHDHTDRIRSYQLLAQEWGLTPPD